MPPLLLASVLGVSLHRTPPPPLLKPHSLLDTCAAVLLDRPMPSLGIVSVEPHPEQPDAAELAEKRHASIEALLTELLPQDKLQQHRIQVLGSSKAAHPPRRIRESTISSPSPSPLPALNARRR